MLRQAQEEGRKRSRVSALVWDGEKYVYDLTAEQGPLCGRKETAREVSSPRRAGGGVPRSKGCLAQPKGLRRERVGGGPKVGLCSPPKCTQDVLRGASGETGRLAYKGAQVSLKSKAIPAEICFQGGEWCGS